MSEAIQHRSLAHEVYHRLLKQIMDGTRPPGSKLSEQVLCDDLGVSRTPAREALMMLHRDGVVERLPRRGCSVRAIDAQDATELFECRKLVECMALDLAFERISEPALKRLASDLSGPAGKRKIASLALDDRLHELVLTSCPNRHLQEFGRQLVKRSYPYRLLRTYDAESVAALSNERRQIVCAILRHDKPLALQLLGEHILHGTRQFARRDKLTGSDVPQGEPTTAIPTRQKAPARQ